MSPYLALFSSDFKFRIISSIHIFEKPQNTAHFRMPVATIIQAYSSFLIIGALIGFMKRGAVQPLIVALVIAIVGFYAAGIENKHPKRANQIIGVLSAAVTVYMGSYWVKYGKFMHAGLVACVSFAVCSLNIRRSF